MNLGETFITLIILQEMKTFYDGKEEKTKITPDLKNTSREITQSHTNNITFLFRIYK